MSDDIHVDFGALAAAEDALRVSQSAIAAELALLNDNLKPLLASWQGDGGAAYTVQQSTWNRESDQLNLTLAAVHQAVGVANAGYQLTDQQVASAWSGV